MARFYQAPPSRLLITKWDPTAPHVEPILTFLDRRARNRRATFELGAPSTFSGEVPSADPEINILHDESYSFTGTGFFDNESYPFLAEGVRLFTWLRRENPGSGPGPWVARMRGLLLTTEDSADTEFGVTRFQAYDPWAYLFKRPCLRCVLDSTANDGITCEVSGGLAVVDPIPKGDVIFPAGTELQYIAGEMLRRTIDANGPTMIDAGDGSSGMGDGNDYGGTVDWTGTIETCATLTTDWRIQSGTTVGECWRQLHETGLLKIILTPVYDVDRPGVCADLNIFRTDSAYNGLYERQAAIGNGVEGFPYFYWDRSGHDVLNISRVVDGTERVNKLQYLGPNGYRAGVVTSAQSLDRFGEYWSEEQFNRLTREDQINVQAQKSVNLREQGRRTWQISPTPEFTYRVFQDYDLGYFAALYHSNRLREDTYPMSYGNFVISAFEVEISDEGTEAVGGVMMSIDDSWDPDAP